jgi:hypothetical protein
VLFLLCSVVAQISEPLGVLRQVMKPHNSARYKIIKMGRGSNRAADSLASQGKNHQDIEVYPGNCHKQL